MGIKTCPDILSLVVKTPVVRKFCKPEFEKCLNKEERRVSVKVTMLANITQQHFMFTDMNQNITQCWLMNSSHLNQHQITQWPSRCKNFIVRLMFSLTFSLVSLEKVGSGPITLISYCDWCQRAASSTHSDCDHMTVCSLDIVVQYSWP